MLFFVPEALKNILFLLSNQKKKTIFSFICIFGVTAFYW